MDFEKYIGGMALRDKVAHLLCPGIRSVYLENSDRREYCDYIFSDKTIKPGIIFMFPSEGEEISKTIVSLEERFGFPLLVAMDFELDPSIIGGTRIASGMAISATNDTTLAYTAGESCAIEGGQYGANYAFGPVLDLNKNRSNPITNTRSWGDNPEQTIPMLTSFVKGVQDNGMIATGKHFPGDGMDDRDQHLCTSVNNLSKEEWMESYGKVWKSLIDSGIKSIMPGHIALPSFEEDGEIRPTTLSKSILTGLLREKLGFEGLIMSDALNMGGILGVADVEECIVGAVEAGADSLLFVNFLEEMPKIVDMLENAVKSGRLTEKRIDESIYRIWKAKKELGLFDEHKRIAPTEEQLKKYKEASEEICKKSITVFRNKKGVLPLDKNKINKVISVDISNWSSFENPLDIELEKNGIEVLKYGDHTENGFFKWIDAPKADAIILNFHYSPQWATSSIRPQGEKLQKVYEYIFKLDIPTIVIAHGSPYIGYEFPHAKTVINTYTLIEADAKPLYNVIFGEQEAYGISPVKID